MYRATFSIDQVLVADRTTGYAVHTAFATGVVNNDPDIDPGQTAIALAGLAPNLDERELIVCVSEPRDASSNEPYVTAGRPGEVAVTNRPIIQPVLSALGAGGGGFKAWPELCQFMG